MTMKRLLAFILLAPLGIQVFAGDKPAYRLFDREGREVKYSKMMKELEDADIIFFGELHTDPLAHWMQLEMTKDLFDLKKEDLVLGAEMFEADNQLILDEYLAGRYEADKFEAEMKLWGNYQTDYKPLVEFARKNHIPFVATNIPRRYASMVNYKGFGSLDGLSDEAKRFIAPLPILYDPEVKCYKDMLEMPAMGMPAGGMKAMPGETKAMPDTTKAMPVHQAAMPGMMKGMPPMENLPKAQAAKDATMAYFILENWKRGKTLFHLNGSYHSDNFEGIVWHLKQKNGELKIMTIATVQQEDLEKLDEENLNIANFILCVPESMTRTNR
jgi:uncharacterized iron-regulated protein